MASSLGFEVEVEVESVGNSVYRRTSCADSRGVVVAAALTSSPRDLGSALVSNGLVHLVAVVAEDLLVDRRFEDDLVGYSWHSALTGHCGGSGIFHFAKRYMIGHVRNILHFCLGLCGQAGLSWSETADCLDPILRFDLPRLWHHPWLCGETAVLQPSSLASPSSPCGCATSCTGYRA